MYFNCTIIAKKDVKNDLSFWQVTFCFAMEGLALMLMAADWDGSC